MTLQIYIQPSLAHGVDEAHHIQAAVVVRALPYLHHGEVGLLAHHGHVTGSPNMTQRDIRDVIRSGKVDRSFVQIAIDKVQVENLLLPERERSFEESVLGKSRLDNGI